MKITGNREKVVSDDANRRRITDEAVGERPASTTPEVARDRVPEAAQQSQRSVGSQASIAARTAEAMGERVSTGAYADPATDRASGRWPILARRSPMEMTAYSGGQSYLMMAAIFALGYATAWLIHRR
jgi:hypothetical protein